MKITRPRYHHGALGEALLAEAVVQVRERGAEQVSLRGLAQRVGVSASAAYQHFPDKAALLVAVGDRAFDELARRMRATMAAVTAEGDAGAIERLAAIGRAYIGFAVEEPHLFRHMFGALMAGSVPPSEAAEASEGSAASEELELPDEIARRSAHGLMVGALAELQERGMLRPGVRVGEGLDVLTWSMVHGFSSLLVEGHLPAEAAEQLVLVFGRLVLGDAALAGWDPVRIARPTVA